MQVLGVDVTDAATLSRAVAALAERFSRLDVVVTGAGTSEPSYDDAWKRLRSVNLDAVIRQDA